jgi:hypothetical protein
LRVQSNFAALIHFHNAARFESTRFPGGSDFRLFPLTGNDCRRSVRRSGRLDVGLRVHAIAYLQVAPEKRADATLQRLHVGQNNSRTDDSGLSISLVACCCNFQMRPNAAALVKEDMFSDFEACHLGGAAINWLGFIITVIMKLVRYISNSVSRDP